MIQAAPAPKGTAAAEVMAAAGLDAYKLFLRNLQQDLSKGLIRHVVEHNGGGAGPLFQFKWTGLTLEPLYNIFYSCFCEMQHVSIVFLNSTLCNILYSILVCYILVYGRPFLFYAILCYAVQ